MSEVVLKRLSVTDSAGKRVGVILPLEQFAQVELILEHQFPTTDDMEKLERMRRATDVPHLVLPPARSREDPAQNLVWRHTSRTDVHSRSGQPSPDPQRRCQF